MSPSGKHRDPIHVAIKFPSRIRVEHTRNYSTFQNETSLNFHGSDGSRLTVVLSDQQIHALMGIRATDPLEMARDLYVAGHIEVDEFERRVEWATEHDPAALLENSRDSWLLTRSRR